MLNMGMSIVCKSSGILKVQCNMRPPVSGIVAMPLDTVARQASAILPSDHSLDRIRLIKEVLPVPPGASKNNIPPHH